MRFLAMGVGALAALVGGAVLAWAEPPKAAETKEVAAKKEFKRLEGTWELVSMECGGEQVQIPDDKKLRTLVVKDGRATCRFHTLVMDMTWTLNPSKTPKELDISFKGLLGVPRKDLAIYELNGDEFKECTDGDGKKRPRAFTTAPGSLRTVYVFKRMKT